MEKYAAEKQKLLDYLNNTNDFSNQNVETETDKKNNANEISTKKRKATNSKGEVPNKKQKLDNETTEIDKSMCDNIIDFKLLSKRFLNQSMKKSLTNSATGPTLRQLKIANAIIKIVRERQLVENINTLGNLVCKEIGPPVLDTQALKRYLCKLAADGQLRIYKIPWPGFVEKNTLLICLPHIKKNDPIVLSIYSKIILQAKKNYNDYIEKKQRIEYKNKLFTHTYSRYLKMRKLHEFLFDLVCLNPSNVQLLDSDMNLPKGFASFGHIVPEIPLELAIGHLSVKKLYELSDLCTIEADPKIKLKDAPKQMLQSILYTKGFPLALKNSFDFLVSFGLIQVCFNTNLILNCLDDKKREIFYVNRNAKVVDTRGSWPSNPTQSRSKKVYTFSFQNMDEVHRYWSIVHDICIGTKVVETSQKPPVQIPVRSIEEVQSLDNGSVLGDGGGPGGFHSSYRTEKTQLWQPFSILPFKKVPQKPLPPPKITKVKKPPQKRKVNKALSKKKLLKNAEQNQKITQSSIKLKKKREKKALWSKWDDEIILWSKVAMTVLSPSAIGGFLQIANLVAKDLLALKNVHRTVKQCIRRVKLLEFNTKFVHRKQLLINELRHHDSILKKYDGLLKKIRSKHMSNLNKYVNEGRLKCLELVWIIQQLAHGIAYRNLTPAIALNIDDFHKKYSVVLPNTRKSMSWYITPEECPIEVGTIKEAIILVLCLNFNTKFTIITSSKIFDTFNTYPEPVLRMATEQLHKSSAVAIRDKYVNTYLQKPTCNDIVQYTTGYKLSSFYLRRWANRLNSTFVDNISKLLESYTPCDNIKASSEICCLLCELHISNAINISTTKTPIISEDSMFEGSLPFLELEMRNNFKSGSVGWSNKCMVTSWKDLYKKIDYRSAILSIIK